MALELIALLLLHRLPFGRVNLRLLSRRRCDKRETDQRDEDHCSLHGYAPDATFDRDWDAPWWLWQLCEWAGGACAGSEAPRVRKPPGLGQLRALIKTLKPG